MLPASVSLSPEIRASSGAEAVFKQVKTGIIGDSDIEMIEGVKDGDEIVIGSYRTLRTLKNEALLKIEAQGGKGSK